MQLESGCVGLLANVAKGFNRHDRATRRVLPVVERADARDATLKLFNLLMGKGEASGRRGWMEEKGHLVEADV